MNGEMLIVFGVLVATAVLFVSNRVRSDIVALAALLTLQLTGVLSVSDALAGFSDPVVMVIISMFIISEALVYTGIAQYIGMVVMKWGKGHEGRLIVLLMLAIGGVGAFMSSTSAIAIFLPIALSVARKAGLNRRRLLMPLSVAAVISGMMTLIATGPNLIVDKALRAKGYHSIGFFSFTPFGVTVLILGTAFMVLVGRRLLAKEQRGKKERKWPTAFELIKSYGLDKQIHRVGVTAKSPWVDRALSRIQMRQTYGLHAVAFEKHRFGRSVIVQAMPDVVIDSGDEVVVVGDPRRVVQMVDDNQLSKMPLDLPYRDMRRRQEFLQKVGLAEVMLVRESKLIGRTLRELQFQEHYRATVVAIRRRGEPITGELTDIRLDFGDALLVNGRWSDILSLRNEREDMVVLTFPEEFRDVTPGSKRSVVALVILASMVTAMALRLLPTVTAAMLGAVLLIAGRCVELAAIYRAVNWQAVVLIAAILPLATALETSGVMQLLSTGLVTVLGGLGPTAMLAAVFLVTTAVGLFVSNTPAAVLMAPIAIDVAHQIGASPYAFAMTVAIACSAAYVSPISSPVNMIVLESGGYRFWDFARVGLPLLLLTLVVTVALALLIYG